VTATELIRAVEEVGGLLTLVNGNRILYELPEGAEPLITCLRDRKPEVIALLRARSTPPPLPAGVALVRWEPKDAPVAITSWSVVVDVPGFVRMTIGQLQAALEGENWQAGNWSIRELVERL